MGTRRRRWLALSGAACVTFLTTALGQERVLLSVADLIRQASHQTTVTARTALEPPILS